MADQVVTLAENTQHSLKLIKWAWTSATDGTVSSQTNGDFTGFIKGCFTDPGATAPTAAYDVTILDEDGIDVILGNGADRSATATEFIKAASASMVFESKLTLTIANAGAEKTGTVYLYIQE